PSKIVKILEMGAESSECLAADLTCANTDMKGFRSPLRLGVPPPILMPRMGSGRKAVRYACWSADNNRDAGHWVDTQCQGPALGGM
ncbi:MAG TPA: hypothetical protein VMU95_27760, partial [Trebonia sp.]|nr:hypothetical protein [Trebonia sp.]